MPKSAASQPLFLYSTTVSDVGTVRANNQDSSFAGEHLIAMCDGMGGHAGGDTASSIAIRSLAHIEQDDTGGNVETISRMMETSVMAAHDAIVGKAIGTTAMVVPLTFAAAPYVARMVESSIKEVPFGVIEAAQSMGASPWQIVWKVLVPEAKPSLMVGGAISIVTILGYSAMAGFIGGGGLGTVAVNYGYNRYNFPIMLIAVIIIVVVVQIFQEVGMRLAHHLDKRNR